MGQGTTCGVEARVVVTAHDVDAPASQIAIAPSIEDRHDEPSSSTSAPLTDAVAEANSEPQRGAVDAVSDKVEENSPLSQYSGSPEIEASKSPFTLTGELNQLWKRLAANNCEMCRFSRPRTDSFKHGCLKNNTSSVSLYPFLSVTMSVVNVTPPFLIQSFSTCFSHAAQH